MSLTVEQQRLLAHRQQKTNWKLWGPYLSERAWGTVREDYSAYGTAWDYFPHDHARSRAYRWNEDGLAGISDRQQFLCFAWALWNGRDPILKERLFGLTGPEGNHGEDVKEAYFYLDSSPTHSYMKMLYKYPQVAFPYGELVAQNGRRTRHEPEYELWDTGVFHENRYFDITIEYAKADENDILIRLTAVNRGPETAVLTLLPTLWFRNTWTWGYDKGPMGYVAGKPRLWADGDSRIMADHPVLGHYTLHAENPASLLFTENETNAERLFGVPNATPYVKDAFHRALIYGESGAVNPAQEGTKAAVHYQLTIPAGETAVRRLRLTPHPNTAPFNDFDALFAQRLAETDAFYAAIQPSSLSEDEKRVQRQAWAGMLWSKQLYYYDVEQWLDGDPAGPPPPAERQNGRNHNWAHLNNFDILSMPDKWEYPWYAAWDLAFHALPLAQIDPDFAKRQLILMTREWYMHPNGQLPAYEWAFGDVNPPVHAWAVWRVYQMDAAQNGRADRPFLEAVFHKLLLNFTWWVNRKDADGRNVFQGGFLGLDNISLFDRSAALPTGGHLDQSDGTAWMGFFSLTMLRIALELARENPVYQDLATKFFEHFLAIATAMSRGFGGEGLWDEEDGFYYDVLHLPDGLFYPLKVRSLVGLMPLIAVEVLDAEMLAQMPDFRRRMAWFLQNRPHLSGNIMCSLDETSGQERHIVDIVTPERLRRVLGYLLDENEFLSPYGIRSLSKIHQTPYQVHVGGQTFHIAYEPGESQSDLFGGNSNWRGPVWFPINYLLIESLHKHHHYYGDEFKVAFPTGSGNLLNLKEVAGELTRRLVGLFLPDGAGQRPFAAHIPPFQQDPHWRDLLLFHEYFHGDSGAGLGASHQTGWTGLAASLFGQPA
ncbi:MAG: glucosidase [Chloroflexi bacterium]|nr:glucosidase [Ardenticatenaceae bacterium]MBL1129398.1 glucosidase [Chloroflexota bacterium]NOG35478.1 glucosidase [Chloroflexota bacterium]GIK57427.1 MAG: glucosidase [Chloroflexota bacterium]